MSHRRGPVSHKMKSRVIHQLHQRSVKSQVGSGEGSKEEKWLNWQRLSLTLERINKNDAGVLLKVSTGHRRVTVVGASCTKQSLGIFLRHPLLGGAWVTQSVKYPFTCLLLMASHFPTDGQLLPDLSWWAFWSTKGYGLPSYHIYFLAGKKHREAERRDLTKLKQEYGSGGLDVITVGCREELEKFAFNGQSHASFSSADED